MFAVQTLSGHWNLWSLGKKKKAVLFLEIGWVKITYPPV